MTQVEWQRHTIQRPDLTLTYYAAGTGQPVIFLAGGPGDDHQPMRSLAEPMTEEFQCILLDQRGTGESRLAEHNPTTLHIDRCLEDIEALRRQLGVEQVGLIGHSWGAKLALLYAIVYPPQVARAALIGLGPLDAEMSAVAAANLQRPLSVDERIKLQELRHQRREYHVMGDFEAHREIHIRMVTQYYARSWFYLPEAREIFAAFYEVHYNYNPQVPEYLLPSVDEIPIWERLAEIEAPLLVVYGYQDFEPVTQAYRIQGRHPQTTICLLNECGHVPWFEQPAACNTELSTFFRGYVSPNEARPLRRIDAPD